MTETDSCKDKTCKHSNGMMVVCRCSKSIRYCPWRHKYEDADGKNYCTDLQECDFRVQDVDLE